jgi:hypothetical protein
MEYRNHGIMKVQKKPEDRVHKQVTARKAGKRKGKYRARAVGGEVGTAMTNMDLDRTVWIIRSCLPSGGLG